MKDDIEIVAHSALLSHLLFVSYSDNCTYAISYLDAKNTFGTSPYTSLSPLLLSQRTPTIRGGNIELPWSSMSLLSQKTPTIRGGIMELPWSSMSFHLLIVAWPPKTFMVHLPEK